MNYVIAAFFGAALFAVMVGMCDKDPGSLAHKHCQHIDSRTEYDKCFKEFLK
jgi:hypothetical protein